MTCPVCGGESTRVIYLGVMFWACKDLWCGGIWGFWSFVPIWIPIGDKGWMFWYVDEGQWYPAALWEWLWYE